MFPQYIDIVFVQKWDCGVMLHLFCTLWMRETLFWPFYIQGSGFIITSAFRAKSLFSLKGLTLPCTYCVWCVLFVSKPQILKGVPWHFEILFMFIFFVEHFIKRRHCISNLFLQLIVRCLTTVSYPLSSQIGTVLSRLTRYYGTHCPLTSNEVFLIVQPVAALFKWKAGCSYSYGLSVLKSFGTPWHTVK